MNYFERLLAPFRCELCGSLTHGRADHCATHPNVVRSSSRALGCMACLSDYVKAEHDDRERERMRDLDMLAERIAFHMKAR